MNYRFHRAAALAVAVALSACTHAPTPASHPTSTVTAAPVGATAKLAIAPPVTDAATSAAISAILAGHGRSESNRARDSSRHPLETLQFFGIRANMTVMEVWPGGSGWYAEILAPLLREQGRYIAAEHDPLSSAYAKENVRALTEKFQASPEVYGRAEIVALQAPNALSPVAPGSVDMILTFRNLHNWLARPDATQTVLAAMYAALKPGGILGIVDHRADPMAPVDPVAKLGYVNEHYAIELAEQAGFEFLGASDINANPKDTKDYDQGVWTLPPTYRLGDKDRDRYTAIGESDRFTLRFRKPLARR
jgi:predicted methyltransferase